MEASTSLQRQPGEGAVVWQHNRLAEARYELTPREQKLVLYVIAMIEPEDDDFKRYVVNVSDFAQLANLSKSELYRELRELAEGLKSKVLIIPNHFDSETGKTVKLVTSWFSDALISPNGEGYFAVEISRNLKPYLLQVKKEFFQFKLQQVMQMRSAYAIRLYQWAKRWQFRRKIAITVADLRGVLGAAQSSGKGDNTPTSLAQYADFKRRAIATAVKEINEKSDLSISFTEIKFRGSKGVESLNFVILAKDAPLDAMPLPGITPQLELQLTRHERDADEVERIVSEAKAMYGLSAVQANKVRKYCETRGAAYVQQKMDVVNCEPRDNPGRAFMAALRDDWQLPRKTDPSKRKSARSSSAADPEESTPADSNLLQQQAGQLFGHWERDPRYKRYKNQGS